MTADSDLVVGVPERFDRRLRLGPFASSHHALKFVAYAALGGLLALGLGLAWWAPFLGAGLVLTLPNWEGAPPDQRCWSYLRWRFRRLALTAGSNSARGPVRAERAVHEARPGLQAAGVLVRGVPLAYLPVEDRRALFEEYRALLRALGPGAVVTVGVEPLPSRPFLPDSSSTIPAASEQSARDGYAELVRLVCRQRFRRRVRWLFWASSSGQGLRDLDDRVERFCRQVVRLGGSTQRLTGKALGAHLGSLGLADMSRPP